MTDVFKKEMSRLREAFYQAFDRGRMTDAFHRLVAGRSVMGFEEIGSGMHFKCWRDRAMVGGMSLVVKVSTPELLVELGNQDLWIKGLDRIGAGVPLIPPFEVIDLSSSGKTPVGMVMPYGESAPALDFSQPRQFKPWLADFYRQIEVMGMELGDIPQIRVWDGVPFIVDLSDLRSQRRSV